MQVHFSFLSGCLACFHRPRGHDGSESGPRRPGDDGSGARPSAPPSDVGQGVKSRVDPEDDVENGRNEEEERCRREEEGRRDEVDRSIIELAAAGGVEAVGLGPVGLAGAMVGAALQRQQQKGVDMFTY